MRRDYFEGMYAANPDPWGFQTRWYEQRKYALTLGALTRAHYGSVFEPGCSIGVLSAELARRCDRLLSCDLVEVAVEQAAGPARGVAPASMRRPRCGSGTPTTTGPRGCFDLVVVSEMLYYLERRRRDGLHAPGGRPPRRTTGEIVLVHWRQRVPEYPLTGDEAHEIACATSGLGVVAHYEDDDLRLDVLARPGAPTVADRESLRD